VLAVQQGPRDNHAAVPAGGVLPLRGRGYTRRRLAESTQGLEQGRNREGQAGIRPDAQGIEEAKTAMNDELVKTLATIPEEMESYARIRRLVRCGQFAKALESVKQSPISESTKKHLQRVLETNSQYIIDRTFLEIDSRIAQALCWGCWRN